MLSKKVLLLSIFLIALLSLSVVSAEEINTDAISLDDSGDDVVSLDDSNEDVVGLDDSSEDIVSSDDVEEPVLSEDDSKDLQTDDSKDSESVDLETGDEVEINAIDSVYGDADPISNTKEKAVLKSSYDDYPVAYINPVTTYYYSSRYVYLGWYGYFSGYFKVYKGTKLVHNEYVYGYDKSLRWSTNNLNVGTHTAKLIDDYYGLMDSAKIVIKKATSKISVKSFKTTARTRFHCYAYVVDKRDGLNIDGGYVRFKIAGKTYKAKLKNGVASFYFKVPKKAKKYICKAIYLGGTNVAKSSTKFKMIVKKKIRPKYKILTVKVRKDRYKSKKWRKYKAQTYFFRTPSMSTVCMYLYKKGKMVDGRYYLTKIHYKYRGKWYWTKWRGSYGEAVYHKTSGIDNSVKINKVKFKFRYK